MKMTRMTNYFQINPDKKNIKGLFQINSDKKKKIGKEGLANQAD